MPARVLMVGFDGMEPSVLQSEIAAGRLPHLAALQRRARTHTARNLPGFGQGVFWPCMYTGVNPGRHGRFFRLALNRRRYTIGRFEEDLDVKAPPFWQRLDARGLRTAAIDVLECPLAQLQHGVQVADWLTHDATGQPRSTPDPRLVRRLQHQYGSDAIPHGSDEFIGAGGSLAALEQHLARRIEAKTRCVADMTARSPWDFFFVTYSEPHDIGHMAWHEHEAALAAGEVSDPVRRVYARLDDALGRLVESATAAEATVCVLAGAGMRRHVLANHLLAPVLRILDLGPARALGRSDPTGHVLQFEPPPAPPRRHPAVARIHAFLRRNRVDPTRASRRFFPVPHNDNAGAIRFNVVGRDPCGKVQPGAELESLVQDVCTALRGIVHAGSGAPLVDEIVRVRDVIDGPCTDDFPDLLVSWSLAGNATAIESPRIGRIESTLRSTRSGDHSRDALFLAAGPGIAPGVVAEPITPMDVGASVEGLFGPLPECVEGRALLP